ncbi:uncharacterized protein LOC117305172 [Asterias rubens]|uniref:uncharacterized protein LOC117305172 n=1 Tax=Asterias rubens TaxID=7604 RepID=UPI0014557C3A|nr:uncharacterized protein LOC117305172 [Asterias rubens]
MELSHYIMKFPAYWRGVFAPLSKDSAPIIGAHTWMLENREGAHTLHSMRTTGRHSNQVDWVGFVVALSEIEPVESGNCLVFFPRILLFPVNIQRNTLAFLSEHLTDVPVIYLDKLLQSLTNQKLTDEWIKLHLRKIQDYVCWRQCQYFNTGFCADDQKAKLTKASWITFTNICQQIRDHDNSCKKDAASKLQFDWLPEALTTNQRDCGHHGRFAAERVTTEKRKMVAEMSEDAQMEEVEGSPMKKRKAEEGRTTPDVIIIDSDSHSPMELGVIGQDERVDEDLLRSQTTNSKEAARLGGRETGVAAYRLHDNMDDVIDAVTRNTLTAIKKLLSDPSAAETLPPDLLRLLIDCPSHHLEAYCDYLMLDSIPAIGLNALAQELTWFKLELSHLNAVVLARRCFLKQIQALNQTAPRSLISAVVNHTKAFPKPMIEGTLIPALTEEGHCGGVPAQQCDLVAKVVKEALTNEERVHLIGKIFSVAGLQWSEDLTIFVQTVVGCKLELNAESLDAFIVALEHHGTSQKSCAKFAKLLLAVVNRFSKQISPTSHSVLQRFADANQTFLKKALITALKRVKG